MNHPVKAWAISVDGILGKCNLSPNLSAYQIFDDSPQEFISGRNIKVVEVEIRPIKTRKKKKEPK